MLVLTRKKGERVQIGDDIVITLIDIRGDGVRIGFDAPRGVKIQRAEVVKAVSEANTASASASAETEDLLVGLLAAAQRPARRAAAADVEPPQASDGAPEPASPVDATGTAPGQSATAVRPAASTTGDLSGKPKPMPPRPRL